MTAYRGRSGRPAVWAVILLTTVIGPSLPICVLDNKKGWWLDCGLRDSYLFRIKDFGGVTASFDFALGLGDERGFPMSIANTNGNADVLLPYPPEVPTVVIPPFHGDVLYSRSSGSEAKMPPGAVTAQQLRYGEVEDPAQHRSDTESSSSSLWDPLGIFKTLSNTFSFSSPSSSDSQQWRRQRPNGNQRRPPPFPPGVVHPEVIPDVHNNGMWVKLPAQQVLKNGRPVGIQYLPTGPPPNMQKVSNHQGGIPNPGQRPLRQNNPNLGRPQGGNLVPPPPAPNPEIAHQVFTDQGGAGPNILELRKREREQARWRRVQQLRNQNNHLKGVEDDVVMQQLDGATRSVEAFRSPPPLPRPVAHVPAPLDAAYFEEEEEPYDGPVIGPVLAEVLQLSPQTPADSDHVPSFAAQLLSVRDAPTALYPPGYNATKEFTMMTKLPRTKFFCEEQEFLPGLYADVQLGCKIFHLCVPAALGSTIQSFLCPNSTLFDQSILQCNYWELVDCSQSPRNYDANQPLALSYRRVNAAHLPVGDVHDPLTLSLLEDTRGGEKE